MGNEFKAQGEKYGKRVDGVSTANPDEWLALVEEKGELVHCLKRAAKMHKKYCTILRRAIPSVSDTGYQDKTLKSINICNDCPVTRKLLSADRFLNVKFEPKEEVSENVI